MIHPGLPGSEDDPNLHAEPEPMELMAAESLSPERIVQAQEEYSMFCRAIRQLPMPCRHVFLLRKVYDVSRSKVARALEISESAVQKHVSRGLLACACYMEAKGYDGYLWPGTKKEVRGVGRSHTGIGEPSQEGSALTW
jgi:DNA-directed RNA polymerase specialized sigma24 family protein